MKPIRIILLLALAVAIGYGVRTWQDTGRMSEMQNGLLSLWYLHYQRSGSDAGQIPHDLWRQTKWADQLASDLRRPIHVEKTVGPEYVVLEDEDFWGTAYLITHEGQSLNFQESMSDSVQDDQIRFLCFVVRKKCALPTYGGGSDIRGLTSLGTYPPAAMNRNLKLIKPTLGMLLAGDREGSGMYVEHFLASRLSEPWAQQMCVEHFRFLAERQRFQDCQSFWSILADAATGRGLSGIATLPPEARAGAAVVLKAIRAVSWAANSPESLRPIGRMIDEYIHKFPTLAAIAAPVAG